MYRNSLSFLFGIMILFSCFQAQASVDEHCSIKPNQLNDLATEILISSQQQDKEDEKNNVYKEEHGFPSTIELRSDVFGQFGTGKKSKLTATYEAFARVEKSGTFSVLPFPLAVVELNRERNIVYICAHIEPDSRHNFLEIYFLTGYNLGELSLKTFVGDMVFNHVAVDQVSISPIGFDTVTNLFDALDGRAGFLFDLVKVPFEIASQAQRVLMTAIKTVIPISGIERIILTNKEVIFSTNVDLDNPESANSFSITLNKKPELKKLKN